MSRAWLARVAIGAWGTVTVVVIGLLMVNHTVAMPSPGDPAWVARGVRPWLDPQARTVVHVIADGCSCTDSLFRHLVARGPTAGLHEHVAFVGRDPAREAQVTVAGFTYSTLTPQALGSELGIEAAPVLVVADPDGTLRYVGGYFRFPAANRPLDVAILTAIEVGEPPDPLPVFGCAISPTLRARIDPLGLQGW